MKTLGLFVMYQYLTSFIGVPYIWGGNNPLVGFDCSGLVMEGLKRQGLVGPHEDLTSQGIYERLVGFKHFAPETVHLQENDLLFFGTSPMNITHISVARDNHIMLEAGGGDSSCTSVEISKQKNAFVRERPIRMRRDLVATIRL